MIINEVPEDFNCKNNAHFFNALWSKVKGPSRIRFGFPLLPAPIPSAVSFKRIFSYTFFVIRSSYCTHGGFAIFRRLRESAIRPPVSNARMSYEAVLQYDAVSGAKSHLSICDQDKDLPSRQCYAAYTAQQHRFPFRLVHYSADGACRTSKVQDSTPADSHTFADVFNTQYFSIIKPS